jgi:ABC-type multidrug transport system fused ATPase/permease subunit
MATDVSTIAQFCYPFANQLVSAPIMLVTALALLYAQIRWATFIGLAVLLASSPTSALCVKKITALRRVMLKHTDARVRLTSQLISGCRTLKLYGWEGAHEAAVLKERTNELAALRAAVPARVGMQTLLFAAPVLAAVASFTAYGLAEPSRFVPSNVFTAIALFSLMRLPLILLPFALVEAGNAAVSSGRLARFLLLPDRDEGAVRELEGGGVGLVIEGASFYWPPEEEDEAKKETPASKKKQKKGKKADARPPGSTAVELDPDHAAAVSTAGRAVVSRVASTRYGAAAPAGAASPDGAYWLAGIDLRVSPGDLVAVVGRVGAGKSSLLAAALGDMVVAQGSVSSGGRVAFAAQTPWVANATVRDNVLFGRPYDDAAYADAIFAAALEADLAVLADGDDTEIGEKGVNLSGGQKARVALARAAYSNADLFLFDDPLSAVDVHVGAHIAAELLVTRLKDKGKAVLLATNQLSVLKDATRVIYLENGRIAASGSVDECRKVEGFASMLTDYEATLASAGGGRGRDGGGADADATARAARGAALATEATVVPGLPREPAAAASPAARPWRTGSDAARALARVPSAAIAREARAEALHDGVAGTRVGSGAIPPLDSAAFGRFSGRAGDGGDDARSTDDPASEPATPRGRRLSIGTRIVDLVAGRPSADLSRASGDRRASADTRRPPSRLSSDVPPVVALDGGADKPAAAGKGDGDGDGGGGKADGAPPAAAKGALVSNEDQETGAVTGAVYAWYAARYGVWAAGALLALWTAEQSARVLTNWWLSRWTAAEAVAAAGGPPSNRGLRLGVYLTLSLVFVACTCVRAATNLLGALRASRAVHAAALHAVSRAPTSWHDATPVGRTLNRFSKDTDELDYLTPQSVNDFGNCAMQIAATLVFQSIVQPLFMAGAFPILGLYYLVQLYYRRTYVELQRNDAVTRSPIYALFAESLAGVDTLRAYGRAAEYRSGSDAAVDRNHTAFFAARCADQWLSLRLELCGSALVALVTVLTVATRGRIPPSLAAMAMAEALDLVGFLKYAVQVNRGERGGGRWWGGFSFFDRRPPPSPLFLVGSHV